MKRKGNLVILAGGEGTRLGPIGKIIPKPLMLVYDEPILIRQLSQAFSFPFNRIIVSTNSEKRKEQIDNYLDIFFEKMYRKIEIVVNPAHGNGTLSALLYITKAMSLKEIIMSFADIYFFQNPFLGFDEANMSANTLFVSKPKAISELAKGGIVFTDTEGKNAERIVYPAIKGNKEGHKWSGLTFFSNDTIEMLDMFLTSYPKDKSEEDFIQYCLDDSLKFMVKSCPQFVNVNNLDDIHGLIRHRINELRRRSACMSTIDLPTHRKSRGLGRNFSANSKG